MTLGSRLRLCIPLKLVSYMISRKLEALYVLKIYFIVITDVISVAPSLNYVFNYYLLFTVPF